MSSYKQNEGNWLERLIHKIPGYSGYMDREQRRDLDKRHREGLAERLRHLKTPLTELMKQLTDGGRMFEIKPIDQAIKKLDTLENRIRFASYGYAGFFDVVKIEEPQLNAIYQFDLALIEQVEALEAQTADVATHAATTEGLKSSVAALTARLDGLVKTFDDRHQAIDRYGQEGPPGRPLFT